jgi:hypothetical protein
MDLAAAPVRSFLIRTSYRLWPSRFATRLVMIRCSPTAPKRVLVTMRSEARPLRRCTLFFLPLVAALISFGCTQDANGPSMSNGPDRGAGVETPGLSAALAAQARNTDRLLGMPGVVGTAVGLGPGGLATVQVFTRGADVVRLPTKLEGVPVAVVVTGEVRALPAAPEAAVTTPPSARYPRPVPIGISTGNQGSCSVGTIAARVKLGSHVYALSNNHIYALENLAPIGSNTLQPGRYDLNCAMGMDAVLGPLSKFIPIVFSRTASNVVDAAIVASSTALLDRKTPPNGYGTPARTPATPALGMGVQKYGRTSALTVGWVDGINATVMVTYSTGVARFVGQVLVNGRGTFSRAGDSGSLIVTTAGRQPVALLFAGTSSGYTFANPIGAVLKAFNVTIDGT